MSELNEKLIMLYELQMIDNELIKSLIELKHIENNEAPVQKKFRQLTARKESLDKELNPILQEIAAIGDKTKLLQVEKKETEDKLFGSASGDHKMLQSLQQKREQIIGLIKDNDDTILKKQTDMDGIGIKKHELEQQLKDLKPEYEKVCKDREQKKTELVKNIEEQKGKRRKFKSFEDRSLLTRYQQLQRENNGVAIAVVDEDVCNSCFVEVSMATKKKLEYGEEIVCCTHCGCILIASGAEEKAGKS